MRLQTGTSNVIEQIISAACETAREEIENNPELFYDTNRDEVIADAIGESNEFFELTSKLAEQIAKSNDVLSAMGDMIVTLADRQSEREDPFGHRGVSKSNFYGVS